MASFSAVLNFPNGNNFTVLSCDYEVYQPVDQQNFPNGNPKGGIINILIESGSQSKYDDLAKWAISPTMIQNGSIIFLKGDSTATLKEIDFSGAFCIRYREVFNAVGDGQTAMKIYLTISAKALSINKQAVPENKWPGMSSQSATSNQSNGAPITSFTPDASD